MFGVVVQVRVVAKASAMPTIYYDTLLLKNCYDELGIISSCGAVSRGDNENLTPSQLNHNLARIIAATKKRKLRFKNYGCLDAFCIPFSGKFSLLQTLLREINIFVEQKLSPLY